MLTDVHVALIGHTGKDESRGARGSNAHMGDVDMMVQISVADDIRTATITKINDGAEGVLTRFKMEPVTLGQDEDGDDITTAIVSDDRLDTKKEMSRAKLNKCSDKRWSCWIAAIIDPGKPAPISTEYPRGVTVVAIELWQTLASRAACPRQEPRKAQTRRSAAPSKIWTPCIASASGTDWFGSPTNEPRTDRPDRQDKTGQSPTLSEVQFRTDTDTPL